MPGMFRRTFGLEQCILSHHACQNTHHSTFHCPVAQSKATRSRSTERIRLEFASRVPRLKLGSACWSHDLVRIHEAIAFGAKTRPCQNRFSFAASQDRAVAFELKTKIQEGTKIQILKESQGNK